MADAQEQIEKFQEFVEENYKKKLQQLVQKDKKSLIIDFSELAKFDHELAEQLLEDPENTIRAAEIAISQSDLKEPFRVRFKNLPESQRIPIRDIRSKDIGKLIFFEGIVRQSSDIRPQVVNAKFECPSCGTMMSIIQVEKKFKEPSRCSCGRKGFFKLVRKELVDAQSLVLEEAAEDLEGGEQPKRLRIFLKEDLVEPKMEKKTTPGTKLRSTGIVSEVARPLQTGGISTVFDLVMNANYIEPIQEDFSDIEISQEVEEEIKKLAKDPKIYDRLTRSIAPSIMGHEKIKEALLLQLMGGVRKQKEDGTIVRGDMHILLVGDPGSGKSALLTFIAKAAPKARYIAGKGATGTGLTAAVVKDEFLKGWALEAGALVLANKGICVTGDTEILATENKIYTIKQIMDKFSKGENIKVKCLDYPNLNVKDVLVKNITKRIPDRLFLLEFDSGDELKITEEHPILVWDNGFYWRSVKDVEEGAFITTSLGFPSDDKLIKTSELIGRDVEDLPEYIDDNLMEFLGLMITDGHLSDRKYRIAFYTKDDELKDRFCRLTDILFRKEAKLYLDKRSDVSHIYFNSKNIHLFLQNLGIKKGNKSKNKTDLNRVYNLPHSKIKSFLIGVINGDGSISNRKYGGCMDIVTGLKENVEQYRKLFRKIGIIGRVKEEKTNGGGIVRIKKGGYTQGRLTITGISNLNKIYDERIMSRKLDALKGILKREDRSWRIPNIDILFEKIRNMLPHTKKALLYKNSLKVSLLKNGFGIKRKKLKRILEILKDLKDIRVSREYRLLESIYNNEIYFTKVVKKKKISVEEVYNLEVDHNYEPNYFANFIPVHNCVLDEMDKMTEEDTSALHEGMEQQTITIAKANIQATLRCQTTVLAAANPKFGRFDPYKPVSDQIDMPPALINRFDLIFPIRDLPDKVKDAKIAQHMLEQHQDPKSVKPEVPVEILRKYITYVKQRVNPVLTEEAMEEIKNFYVNLRNAERSGNEGVKPIPITPRQLEALIRLAEGSARVRLSKEITKNDAKRAISLLKYCLSQVGIDPETGQIDIDIIHTGISSSKRNKISIILQIIDEAAKKGQKTLPIEELVAEAEKGMERRQAEEIIEKLKREGELFEPKQGFIQKV